MNISMLSYRSLRNCALLFFGIIINVDSLETQLQNRYDVKLGVDVLAEEQFKPLWGKKIALVSNQTGRSRAMQPTVDLLAAHDSCQLVSVLTPEHGYYSAARAGEHVNDSGQTLRGAKLHSLYAGSRRPSQAMLESCDIVVFELQDVGLRSYTFLGTLYHVMDACAEYGKPLYVLDRPNPLGGELTDGNVLDSGISSFVGIVPVPYLHGCTFGELATMINREGWLPIPDGDSVARSCELTVISMQNWERWMLWEDTDLVWTPTSPYVPSVDAIRGMAMTGIYGELSLLNIGIGYTLPFQMFGMPEFNMEFFQELIRGKAFPGIILVPTEFRPFYGKYSGEQCVGFFLKYYSHRKFKPYTSGLELVLALRKTHPELFIDTLVSENSQAMFTKVTGNAEFFTMLYGGAKDDELRSILHKGLAEYQSLRRKYFLYE